MKSGVGVDKYIRSNREGFWYNLQELIVRCCNDDFASKTSDGNEQVVGGKRSSVVGEFSVVK